MRGGGGSREGLPLNLDNTNRKIVRIRKLIIIRRKRKRK